MYVHFFRLVLCNYFSLLNEIFHAHGHEVGAPFITKQLAYDSKFKDSEMLFKYGNALHPREKRMYQVFWGIFFALWIGGMILAFFTDNTALPWTWVSLVGIVGGMTFGFAVSHILHIWPFYLFFSKDNKEK